ncbi:unnamed protein product, partial [Hymenolepis diminuta]
SKLKKLSEVPTGKALNKKQHCRFSHKNPYSITEERNCFFFSDADEWTPHEGTNISRSGDHNAKIESYF